jgi:hypothetical protein
MIAADTPLTIADLARAGKRQAAIALAAERLSAPAPDAAAEPAPVDARADCLIAQDQLAGMAADRDERLDTGICAGIGRPHRAAAPMAASAEARLSHVQ